ncbi:MAG: ribulose-phosphate 3-epimerase [Planctomycetes bacterium]|nr:ribulose-phosphate 3-epimerase [Planctomycetota bacterium]
MSLLTAPPALPLVAPSILSADFANLGDECNAVIAAGADLLHLDVMDGLFVPNLTMGPALCKSLRNALPDVYLDVHLMVDTPLMYVEPFAKAGGNLFTCHVEASDDPLAVAAACHAAEMDAGIAINPPTDVAELLPLIDAFDLILVMSVNPGFSGQSFIPEVLSKVEVVSEHLRPDQRLQMDGGVGPATCERCKDAGCDVLVAASAIFGTDDYAAAITGLRGF